MAESLVTSGESFPPSKDDENQCAKSYQQMRGEGQELASVSYVRSLVTVRACAQRREEHETAQLPSDLEGVCRLKALKPL